MIIEGAPTEGPLITVYSGKQCNGFSSVIRGSVARYADINFPMNLTIMSILLPPQVSIEVFDEENYFGSSFFEHN